MKIILFGASGMVGQGVLRECLLDDDVTEVLCVCRSPLSQTHPKLRVVLHTDFTDFSAIKAQWATSYHAFLFCVGVSSAGMSESEYSRKTYDYTMAAAQALAQVSPGMALVYVSGTGADSSEKGPIMWARIKGKTENALLALPLNTTIFRPAYIQPMHGIRSRTRLYNITYALMGPLLPLWKLVMPKYVTTTEDVGRAMLNVAREGAPKKIMESADIAALAKA